MSDPVDPAIAAEATDHLARLLDQLTVLGLHARLLTHSERLPRLRVINVDATALAEVISAAPLQGRWWFWWSWAEQIALVDDLDETTRRIHHVLTPAHCLH